MKKSIMNSSAAENEYRARGGATRASLLHQALRLFATKGYDGTSTRDLAQVANVNQAGIAYHFKNKEGLYFAINSWVSTCISGELVPVISAAEKDIAEAGDNRDKVKEALLSFFAELSKILWEDESVQWELMFFQRELSCHEDDADSLRRQLYDPLVSKIQNIVTLVTGIDKKEAENYFIASMLFDSFLSLSRNKSSLSRVLGTQCVCNKKKRRELCASMQQPVFRLMGL